MKAWVCEFCFRTSDAQPLPEGWELVWSSAVCPECLERVGREGGIYVVPVGAYARGSDPRAPVEYVGVGDVMLPVPRRVGRPVRLTFLVIRQPGWCGVEFMTDPHEWPQTTRWWAWAQRDVIALQLLEQLNIESE